MIVVKIGGSEGTDFNTICADMAERIAAGERFVMVHGGSNPTSRLSTALGPLLRPVVQQALTSIFRRG